MTTIREPTPVNGEIILEALDVLNRDCPSKEYASMINKVVAENILSCNPQPLIKLSRRRFQQLDYSLFVTAGGIHVFTYRHRSPHPFRSGVLVQKINDDFTSYLKNIKKLPPFDEKTKQGPLILGILKNSPHPSQGDECTFNNPPTARQISATCQDPKNPLLSALPNILFGVYFEFWSFYKNETKKAWAAPYINGINALEYFKMYSFEKSIDYLKYFIMAANGLENLHKNKIYHRDFSLRNILIDDIAGKAYIIDPDFAIINPKDDQYVGYNVYIAPERAPESSDDAYVCTGPESARKIDIFAFGMCLWFCMNGLDFDTDPLQFDYDLNEFYNENNSTFAKNPGYDSVAEVIEACIQPDPLGRTITLVEIQQRLNHIYQSLIKEYSPDQLNRADPIYKNRSIIYDIKVKK